MQSTTRVRPTAKCAAHITFGEAAGLWLPKCCPCSKIKARAAGLWQPKCCWQQHLGCHNPAVSSIMAEYLAIMLLPAGLWRSNIKALHRYCYALRRSFLAILRLMITDNVAFVDTIVITISRENYRTRYFQVGKYMPTFGENC